MHGNTPSYLRPRAVERTLGQLLAFLVRIGVIRAHFYLLEVRGRKSGKTISLPVDPLDLGGKLYLVSARGETNWARNARTAGEVVLARAMRRRRYAVRELSLGMRPPVLKAYLDRFASEVQRFFPFRRGRQWKHSTIWRRGTRSSNCSHWTKPYSTKAAWAFRTQRVFGRTSSQYNPGINRDVRLR
jgi:hypothetical protein